MPRFSGINTTPGLGRMAVGMSWKAPCQDDHHIGDPQGGINLTIGRSGDGARNAAKQTGHHPPLSSIRKKRSRLAYRQLQR